MSRVYECDGCGERLGADHITFSQSGHLKTGAGSGLFLGTGPLDFCGYVCIERWARLRQAPPKNSTENAA